MIFTATREIKILKESKNPCLMKWEAKNWEKNLGLRPVTFPIFLN